jgi:hypothetical protein
MESKFPYKAFQLQFCKVGTCAFYKRFKFVKNDKHVYIQLKMLKHDHIKRVEVYYKRLMKLANSMETKKLIIFFILVFKFGLRLIVLKDYYNKHVCKELPYNNIKTL